MVARKGRGVRRSGWLYRVFCRGMRDSHGVAYVVAVDLDQAYQRIRTALDATNLGFQKDRELERIELIAAEGMYPDCGVTLYV